MAAFYTVTKTEISRIRIRSEKLKFLSLLPFNNLNSNFSDLLMLKYNKPL
jgi:hypothetical protein